MHALISMVLNLMSHACLLAMKLIHPFNSPKIIIFNEDESGYWIKIYMAAEVFFDKRSRVFH